MKRLLPALLLLLAACTPTPEPVSPPQIIRIYATAATQSWLADAYDCAQTLQLTLSNVDDPTQAEISLRLGEPDQLSSPAYQIGQDDLLIVTHRENQIQNLTPTEAQKLFTNPESETLQLWVFASGNDVQQAFAREVLHGQAVTSLARVAVSPQQMSDSLNSDKNAIGILPRHWKSGTVREVFTIPNLPVLAQVKSDPQGSLKDLLACLQK